MPRCDADWPSAPILRRSEQFFPALDLGRDVPGGRSADRATLRERTADIENFHYVIVEPWRRFFHFRDADLVQRNVFADGVHDDLSNDLVRLAKRRSFFHKVLCQIGREKTLVARCI